MSDSDYELDGLLDADQQAKASQLSAADLRTIDECILSYISHQFRKTAKVVALTMGDVGDQFPGLPDIFYSGRIKLLAAAGLIEAAGNLDRMRSSEVRLPGEPPSPAGTT